MNLPRGLMASVSGFRGRVGEAVTPELFCTLAAEFGSFLLASAGDGRRASRHGAADGDAGAGDPEHAGVVDCSRTPPPAVLLARDTRLSGPMLARAVRAGLESVGLRVRDLGVAPTPTLLLAVARSEAVGGLVVTASHNPAEWNALKLVGADGLFLNRQASDEFRRRLADGPGPERAPWHSLGSTVQDQDAHADHLRAIELLHRIDASRIRERALKVAADCVGGAAGEMLARLLSRLGCDTVGIGMKPDGDFHREAEPLPENLAALGDLVLSEGADLGLAFDPDGDRLALVDEYGEAPGEDLTLALATEAALARSPGPVVTNLSTSRVVEDVAAHFGVPFHRAPVGEINVAERMRGEGAVIGGEGNGGVILPELHLTRDALLASALVVQHLADTGATLSQAIARWPRYSIVKEKAELPARPLAEIFRELERKLEPESVDRTDGLRLEWPSRRTWLHARASGTEPVVRLIAEAPLAADAAELTAIAARISSGRA